MFPLASAPVAVDLFSGGGGLSLGLKKAGFNVCASVELDPIACATYKENHPNAVVFNRDIRSISSSELLSSTATGGIDLIAACPPCQSFSSLTLKYKREDSRDSLINEFARLVREIKPRLIMMENVPGLAQRGQKLFLPVIEEFKSLGYSLDYRVVDVADYGIPQRRKRLVVLGSLEVGIKIPSPTHFEAPIDGQLPWSTVRDTLRGLPDPVSFKSSKAAGGPKAFNWNVVRDISSLNIERYLNLKEGEARTELPMHLRPNCHKSDFGFTNVYGRMLWDSPSPTITGGCTTPSKGRFGHPVEPRAISVREAARLQTFPDDYIFSTEAIDKACLIIGNALPPEFAKIMAAALYKTIRG